LPRDLPERALVAPAPQAPAALLHPAVRVIADERYERGGPDAVVEFAGSLSDDALKDGCLLALIRFELGLEESFEEALSSPEIGAPMNVVYPLPPIPMALPYGARMYPGNEAPQAPPLPGDEAGRPAAPGGRLSRPSASRAPRTTGEGPDLREAGDAGTSGEEGRPIGREQIAGAFAVMEKISSPHMRDGALRTIFEAIEEAGPGGLLDETLVDGAIAQLNSSYELANPYTTDPVD